MHPHPFSVEQRPLVHDRARAVGVWIAKHISNPDVHDRALVMGVS